MAVRVPRVVGIPGKCRHGGEQVPWCIPQVRQLTCTLLEGPHLCTPNSNVRQQQRSRQHVFVGAICSRQQQRYASTCSWMSFVVRVVFGAAFVCWQTQEECALVARSLSHSVDTVLRHGEGLVAHTDANTALSTAQCLHVQANHLPKAKAQQRAGFAGCRVQGEHVEHAVGNGPVSV